MPRPNWFVRLRRSEVLDWAVMVLASLGTPLVSLPEPKNYSSVRKKAFRSNENMSRRVRMHWIATKQQLCPDADLQHSSDTNSTLYGINKMCTYYQLILRHKGNTSFRALCSTSLQPSRLRPIWTGAGTTADDP